MNLGTACADIALLGDFEARYRRRRAIIFRSGGVVLLEGQSHTKRPRRAGAQGGLGADADLLSQIFGAKTQIIGSH
jgi:hypothetical protein